MYAHDDPNILWIAPSFKGKSTGTYQAPFTDITRAVKKAKEGDTIVLKPGDYYNTVSIQISGAITRPIRITVENDSESSVRCHASWYFYDVTDLIVSGLTFTNIPHQALAVIGACKRNSFTNLRFHNCGLDNEGACTFFFGGAGAQCNVVEDCVFECETGCTAGSSSESPIGLMISEGDTVEGAEPNKNHIFRRNRFFNYGCAIVVGTHGTQMHNYSHIVEHNEIQTCAHDGIRLKCGDTVIRGNIITDCRKNGISVAYGKSDTIFNNRIIECGTGVNIAGIDCTVTNNCVIRSTRQALSIVSRSDDHRQLPGNTVIELNTLINNPKGERAARGIFLETDSNCIIRRNIFDGEGKPYVIRNNTKNRKNRQSALFIEDNRVSNGCLSADGCSEQDIDFRAPLKDNYSNTSGFGASGWMVEGLEIPPREKTEATRSYQSAIFTQSSFFEFPGTGKELLTRACYSNTDPADTDEDETDNVQRDSDGIINFSNWDE